MDDFTVGTSGARSGLAAVDNGVVFSAGTGNDLAGSPARHCPSQLSTAARLAALWIPGQRGPGNGTAIAWAVTVGDYRVWSSPPRSWRR